MQEQEVTNLSIEGRSDDRITIEYGDQSKYFILPVDGEGVVEIASDDGDRGVYVILNYNELRQGRRRVSFEAMGRGIPEAWDIEIHYRGISPVATITCTNGMDLSSIRVFDHSS